jgi:hypothetical protein
VANSLEGTTEKDGEEEDRMSVNSNVTQQDLLDSYVFLATTSFVLRQCDCSDRPQ